MNLLRIFLLAAGILMVAMGVARDEAASVYAKAIRICLECIGII